MAALTCDICGGKLLGRPGGRFECDSCGMEYDTDWARAKIQEIRGSVKVEGTVSVKVEGAATAESLIKRGYMALDMKEWDEAKSHFDGALNMAPEASDAYVGMELAEFRLSDLAKLADAHARGMVRPGGNEKDEKEKKTSSSAPRPWPGPRALHG